MACALGNNREKHPNQPLKKKKKTTELGLCQIVQRKTVGVENERP
jgi:hypothetical protein